MTAPAKKRGRERAGSPFSAKNQLRMLSIVQRKAQEGDAQAAAVILLFGVIAGKTPAAISAQKQAEA